jgi:outer membrane biosynthesis protein TonB
VKGGVASQIDWSLMAIAAFSFLAHFAAVGGMYSDWMDPIVDQDITASMTQLVRESGPPPVPEVAQPETPPKTAAVDAPAPAPAPGPVARPTHDPLTPFVPNVRDAMGEINRIGLGTLIALNSKGPSIDSVMDPQKPTIDFTTIGDSHLPVGPSIALPTGDGPVHIHPGVPSPLATAETGPGDSINRAGPVRRIEVTVTSDPPITSLQIPVSNLEAIIRREVFPRARRCYQHGLDSDQNQHGRIVISMKIDTSGMVTGATVAQNTGLSNDVANCILAAAKAPNFGQNPGGTLQVPFNFVRQ